MNNILILGGKGFIGSNLAEFLVNENENVIVFKGDFNDSETVEKVFKENKIDIVIHLISSIIPATPFEKIIKNTEINSTINLLDIMRKRGVNKIMFFSSGGAVYGTNGQKVNKEDSPTNPINFYGWLKLTIESYLQMNHRVHGLNYIILRPSNAYGKRQNIQGGQGLIAVTLGKLLQNKPIEIWGNGEVVRDYIYIDDLCRAVFLLIKNRQWNNVYNVGGGKGTSVNEILRIIKKITGINFGINYKESREVDIPVNILDVSKLKNSIPWGELTGIEEGIKTYWKELNHENKKS